MKKKTAGRYIREWRKKHGLSQENVGEILGVTVKHVKYLETDQRFASPSIATILADHTGQPVTTFLNMRPR